MLEDKHGIVMPNSYVRPAAATEAQTEQSDEVRSDAASESNQFTRPRRNIKEPERLTYICIG